MTFDTFRFATLSLFAVGIGGGVTLAVYLIAGFLTEELDG